MINHIRTLLLNQSGSNSFGEDFPLEEYVPEGFRPAKMSGLCKNIWQTIFGKEPDRAYLNYRLFEIVRCLDTSDLSQHVTKFDSRITYDPYEASEFIKGFDLVEVTKIQNNTAKKGTYTKKENTFVFSSNEENFLRANNEEDLAIFITGNFKPNDGKGIALNKWRLYYQSSDYMTIECLTAPVSEENRTVTFQNGLSEAIPLRQSDLTVKIREYDYTTWNLDVFSKPLINIASVVANLDALPLESLNYIFSGKYPEYEEFKTRWFKDDSFVNRVAAVSLALAYKIEEEREQR